MNDLKSIGSFVLGSVIFLGVIVGSILLLVFGSTVAFIVLPFIYWLAGILLIINIFALLAAIAPGARAVAGIILFISSYVYGLATWIYGLAVTLSLWGMIAVIIGVLLGGVGVVPVGMLAAIFHGRWDIFFTLLATILLTYGTRVIATLLLASAGQKSDKDDIIDVEPIEDERTWKDLE